MRPPAIILLSALAAAGAPAAHGASAHPVDDSAALTSRAAADGSVEIAEGPSGPTTPLVPEADRTPAREPSDIPRPEPAPRLSANAPVIIEDEGGMLPPAPDPARPATTRSGVTVPSPRSPEPPTEPATVILPAEEVDIDTPQPRAKPDLANRTTGDAAAGAAPAAALDAADAVGGPAISATDLIGRAVTDEAGEPVGEVADILLALDTGAVAMVVIAREGGAGRTAVRADRIAVGERGGVVVRRSALGAPDGGGVRQ